MKFVSLFILSLAITLPTAPVLGQSGLQGQEHDSCSYQRDFCRLKCLPKTCIQDGINCNEGRQACVKYCAEQFLQADCKSDSSSIEKPGRCKKMVSNYWPGGKMDHNSLKATCSSESDCLNLINDLILLCGASPVCIGQENKKVSALQAATCAMKDADRRMKVQNAGCGGYICRTQEGFRGDKEFFLSSFISKENPQGIQKAQAAAKEDFLQICRANLTKPSDLSSCQAAASVSVTCKYNINIEGDGCLVEDGPAEPTAKPVKKGGSR